MTWLERFFTSIKGVSYQGTPLANWAVFLLVAIVAYFTAKLAWRLLLKRLRRWTAYTKNNIDNLLLRAVDSGGRIVFISVALYVSAALVDMALPVMTLVSRLVVIGAIVQGALWATRFFSEWVSAAKSAAKDQEFATDAARVTTVGALGLVGKIVIWTLVVLLVLDNLGVNITALTAGMGIGGVAVALALQNVLGDIFASLSIALDKPFVIGDFVIVESLMGTVEHVGLKTTRLRSLSGEQLVFSNTDLLQSRIRNFKKMVERRVVFKIGVEYTTPLEKLKKLPQLIRGIVESESTTRFDRAHFQQFGDFSLDYEIVYFVLDPDYNKYMDIQQSINLRLFEAFENEKIAFAFPTQVVQLQRKT